MFRSVTSYPVLRHITTAYKQEHKWSLVTDTLYKKKGQQIKQSGNIKKVLRFWSLIELKHPHNFLCFWLVTRCRTAGREIRVTFSHWTCDWLAVSGRHCQSACLRRKAVFLLRSLRTFCLVWIKQPSVGGTNWTRMRLTLHTKLTVEKKKITFT